MTRDQRERLDDIAEAIHRIRIVVAEATPETEAIARDATLYNLVIVGEAVKHLDDATKEQAPEIPWRQVAGLRDLLTHEYFRIEMDTIRKIVERDVAPLERAVERLRRPASTGRG